MSTAEKNQGTVVAIRGSVVDIRFERELPKVNTLLYAGERGDIVIEVALHLEARQVRGIALTPAQGVITSYSIHYTKLYESSAICFVE